MAKQKPTKIKIYLNADPTNLWGIDKTKGQGQTDVHCRMTDNNSGSNEGAPSIEKFESYAYQGLKVIFEARIDPKTPTNDYTVVLTSIVCNTFMGQKTKAVKDGKTTITVTVNDSKFLTGTTADYTINFRVTEVASGKTIDYSVDPRIKLNPPPRT